MNMYLVYLNGVTYRIVPTNLKLSRCFKCDLYEDCPKWDVNKACQPFKENVYFREVPLKSTIAPDWDDFDFSTKFVKYKGKRIDKSELKTHINTASYQLGNTIWPLTSDIYWYDMRYAELKKELENKVYLLRALIIANTHSKH